MKLFDLTGKVAIVTGGNGGIGLGMARGLAQAGAAVAVAGRQAGKSAAAVKELEVLGARAMAVEVDVRREASCREMVQAVVHQFGRLDILVNNAGTNIRKRPEEYSLEEYNTVLETNLTSAFVCSQAAYPHMVRAGGRQDHQHRLHDVDLRRGVHGALRGQQGRHRPDDEGDGHRVGEGRHPGQRGAAGLDRHRPHKEGPRAGAGAPRPGGGAHAGRALGHAGGPRRASPCSWRAPPPTSSPARPSRSMAATPSRASSGRRLPGPRRGCSPSRSCWARSRPRRRARSRR